MAVDQETVTLLSAYRVGFMPPVAGSLAAGELYIELGAPPGGAATLWVGGMEDTIQVLVTSAGTTAPPSVPPTNVDVPYVSQDGDTLSCTMGNWTGEPDSYLYQWQLNGTDVGGANDVNTYALTLDDVGAVAACVVSASNAAGVTAAPPSNAVTVAESPPPARDA